ncbi:hypothetical protein VUR80DRAFT_6631 [Thermomyces stellatus]
MQGNVEKGMRTSESSGSRSSASMCEQTSVHNPYKGGGVFSIGERGEAPTGWRWWCRHQTGRGERASRSTSHLYFSRSGFVGTSFPLVFGDLPSLCRATLSSQHLLGVPSLLKEAPGDLNSVINRRNVMLKKAL